MSARVVVYDNDARRGHDGRPTRRINASVSVNGVLRATLLRGASRADAELRAIPPDRLTPRRLGALRALIYDDDPRDEAARIVLNNLDLFSRPDDAMLLEYPERKESP